VVFTASPAAACLFEGKSWGIDTFAYDIRNAASLRVFRQWENQSAGQSTISLRKQAEWP